MLKRMIKKATATHEKRRLLENFFFLSTLQGANYLLPLITFPYLVRVIGVEKYGLMAFVQAFVGYFIILTDYGFNFTGNRLISINRFDHEKVSKLYSSIMVVKMLLLLVSFLLFAGIIFLVPMFRAYWLLYFSAFLMVVGNVLFPVWFFQGMERMRFTTTINIVSKVFFAVCLFVFVKEKEHLSRAVFLNSLGYLLGGVISQYFVFHSFKLKFKFPSYSEIVFQLKDGWSVFVSTVAVSAYSYSRVVAMGIFTNQVITGYYAIADKIITLLKAFPLVPVANTLYPRFSKMYTEDPGKTKKSMLRFQHFLDIFYFMLIPIVFIFSPQIVKLISGLPHQQTVIALRLLLISLLFTAMNALKVTFLLISGRNKDFAIIHVLAGVLGISAIMVGAYLFSFVGVSVALICIEFMVFALTARALGVKNRIVV